MNAIAQAQQAYAPAQFTVSTPRAIESKLISQITSRLRNAQRKGGDDFPLLASALLENRKFWTAMAIDVAGSDNLLPQALRAQIFYLAEFTEIQSEKILSGEGSIDVLIDINTAVLRGLSQQVTQQ